MPSGWKCDLLFKNKIKELIDKYGNDHTKIVKEIMAICGVSENQARSNLQAINELIKIEKTPDIRCSNETIVKKLTPSILLEVARIPENKQQEALQKIDNGELKTVKDMLLIHIKQENNTINYQTVKDGTCFISLYREI